MLPGVLEMLEDLDRSEEVVNLLLTGNTEAGAGRSCDTTALTSFFRRRCVLRRPRRARGIAQRARALADGAEHFYVIGDTPHDIDAGKAIGARTIAVATGSYDSAELAQHEPWLVLERIPRPVEFREIIGVGARVERP